MTPRLLPTRTMHEEGDEGQTMNNGRFSHPLGFVHKFYLVGPVRAPGEYVEWFETIREASERDVVMIYINTFGGDLMTALQLVNAMRESRATVCAQVEGACMSAGTLIFLAAQNVSVADHSSFMFHNYSTMSGGKGGELFDSAMHGHEWSGALLRSAYKDFLTEEEITSILQNKDIYMTSEQVMARLVQRSERAYAAVEESKKPAKKKPAKKAPKK